MAEVRKVDEKSDVEKIVGIFRERIVSIGGRDVRIVDRERDARSILKNVAKYDVPLSVLYGPWGCGKTTFFGALVESIHIASIEDKDRETLFEAIMISYEHREAAEKLVEKLTRIRWSGGVTDVIRQSLAGVSKSVLRSLKPSIGPSGVSLTIDPYTVLSSIVEAIIHLKGVKRDKRLLIVLDEARAPPEDLMIWLNTFANKADEADTRYRRAMGGKLSVVVLTSDATVVEVWRRFMGKVFWNLMWNLPRGDFEKLVDQLEIDADKDLLWKLAGGNPRVLREISRIGFEGWLREAVEKVVEVLKPYWEHKPELLEKAVKRILDDPDALGYLRRPNEPPIEEDLLTSNIVISLKPVAPDIEKPGEERSREHGRASLLISELPEEPWIGRDYAFQLPVYYYTLRVIASKRGLEVSPRDVMEEAGKS